MLLHIIAFMHLTLCLSTPPFQRQEPYPFVLDIKWWKEHTACLIRIPYMLVSNFSKLKFTLLLLEHAHEYYTTSPPQKAKLWTFYCQQLWFCGDWNGMVPRQSFWAVAFSSKSVNPMGTIILDELILGKRKHSVHGKNHSFVGI